ncbi:MAG: hypothetical protein H6745_15425 [Deltaproteobacteria bacterium]|nr:hypothetical protein [Deltaproteobacteria bacterium]
MRRFFPSLSLALFLLALVAPPASATTVLRVEVPEMTRTSAWVVHAHVRDVRSVDLRAEDRGLVTDVTLDIADVYKGEDVPKTYVLRLMGGVGADGMALTIPGMPTFAPGEEVVLFLEKTNLGHVPCGLGQGVYRVRTDKDGRRWVQSSASGLQMMERDEDGRLRAVEPAPVAAQSLETLVARIYAAQLTTAPPAAAPPRPQVAPGGPTIVP